MKSKSIKDMKKISIPLEDDIIEALKSLAEDDERSLSAYIRILLKKHVKGSNG